MPIYEYRCTECSFQEEYLQKLSEPSKTVCPSCGKESFRKLLSAAGFQLKGSGWYVTDFRNKSSGKGETKTDQGADKAAAPEKDGASKPADSKSTDSSGGDSSSSTDSKGDSGSKTDTGAKGASTAGAGA